MTFQEFITEILRNIPVGPDYPTDINPSMLAVLDAIHRRFKDIEARLEKLEGEQK